MNKQRTLVLALVLLISLVLLLAGCKGAGPALPDSSGSGAAQTSGEQADKGLALAEPEVTASPGKGAGTSPEKSPANSPENPSKNSEGKSAADSGQTPPQAETVTTAGQQSPAVSPAALPPLGDSIETTLQDGALQKGSKKNFDVWAKDQSGKKISKTAVTVTLNGQTVPVTWDDTAKTSYIKKYLHKEKTSSKNDDASVVRSA